MTGANAITVAVLGQGSIGRRHAGLLVELGCDVLVWDPAPQGEPVDGATAVATQEAALTAADAAIVASPSSEHLQQLGLALGHGCDVLVEKPLALRAEGVAELAGTVAASGLLVATAFNLRFHPGPAALHRLVLEGAIGRPLRAHASFGSHLPDWRPGTDYRQGYSARADLGGGILNDAIHEVDYVTWILGEVREAGAWLERVSDLELDVEDTVSLTLRHAGGALSTIDLDFLDRSYRRGMRVVGTEASADWDWGRGDVRLLGPGRDEVVAAPSDVASSYRAQLQAFLASVSSRVLADPLCDLAASLHVLRIADAARASARDGVRVAL